MAQWTVSRVDERCSYGCAIPAGEPLQRLKVGTHARCPEHALGGAAVDWQEVELERFRLEADLARVAGAHLRREEIAPERRRPVDRVTPPRPPKPAALFADLRDPKAVAAHNDD